MAAIITYNKPCGNPNPSGRALYFLKRIVCPDPKGFMWVAHPQLAISRSRRNAIYSSASRRKARRIIRVGAAKCQEHASPSGVLDLAELFGSPGTKIVPALHCRTRQGFDSVRPIRCRILLEMRPPPPACRRYVLHTLGEQTRLQGIRELAVRASRDHLHVEDMYYCPREAPSMDMRYVGGCFTPSPPYAAPVHSYRLAWEDAGGTLRSRHLRVGEAHL